MRYIEQAEVVAIDSLPRTPIRGPAPDPDPGACPGPRSGGKTLKGSFDAFSDQKAAHVLSAFATGDTPIPRLRGGRPWVIWKWMKRAPKSPPRRP